MMFDWLAGQKDLHVCYCHFPSHMNILDETIHKYIDGHQAPCILVWTTASIIGKGRLGGNFFLIHLSIAISKYIVHINIIGKIRGMFVAVQNHHHVKLAIVRLSVALLWEQTGTKI